MHMYIFFYRSRINQVRIYRPEESFAFMGVWSGRLTLTNYALYFETSGAITYDKPIKFDLSADSKKQVKSSSTGPWGTLLFDKAVIYESSDM